MIDLESQSIYSKRMLETQSIIEEKFSLSKRIVLFTGDCMHFLADCPDESIQLIVTSPPYNVGKEYEKRLKLENYISQQAEILCSVSCSISERKHLLASR